jgi:hypothetical protein
MGYPSDQNMAFEEDVWYCYVLNVDQRNRKLEHHVYKRNVDDENDAASLSSTILRKVYQGSQDITPITYQIERNVTCQILASDMSVTNIIKYVINILLETILNILSSQIMPLQDYIFRNSHYMNNIKKPLISQRFFLLSHYYNRVVNSQLSLVFT